jgi:hypothetical protein
LNIWCLGELRTDTNSLVTNYDGRPSSGSRYHNGNAVDRRCLTNSECHRSNHDSRRCYGTLVLLCRLRLDSNNAVTDSDSLGWVHGLRSVYQIGVVGYNRINDIRDTWCGFAVRLRRVLRYILGLTLGLAVCLWCIIVLRIRRGNGCRIVVNTIYRTVLVRRL